MVRNRLKVLVSSCATTAVVAIVVGMVGTYFTSAVGVLCVLGGGLIMVWSNHTLLKRIEESEARLRGILDTATDAVITIDSASRIQSFNGAAEAMFGYAAADVLGQNVTMLIPPAYREAHMAELHNYLTTGVPRVIGRGAKVDGQRQDGSTFPIELTVSEARQGTWQMFTGILRDVSARSAVEEHLQRLIQHLTTASQHLEATLTAQGTSTQQVMATAQGIAATSEALLQTMHDMTRLSANTATAAESSHTSLTRMTMAHRSSSDCWWNV